MNINTDLFFLTFCCIITPIFGIIDHYCIFTLLFLKRAGKNKNKLRIIYPKNPKIFRNSKPRV